VCILILLEGCTRTPSLYQNNVGSGLPLTRHTCFSFSLGFSATSCILAMVGGRTVTQTHIHTCTLELGSFLACSQCYKPLHPLHFTSQVEVFRVVTPCTVAVGYQRFRGTYCLHLHFILEAVRFSETSVSYHKPHGVTTQKTSNIRRENIKSCNF